MVGVVQLLRHYPDAFRADRVPPCQLRLHQLSALALVFTLSAEAAMDLLTWMMLHDVPPVDPPTLPTEHERPIKGAGNVSH